MQESVSSATLLLMLCSNIMTFFNFFLCFFFVHCCCCVVKKPCAKGEDGVFFPPSCVLAVDTDNKKLRRNRF